MHVAVLGTGTAGRTLAGGISRSGADVTVGTRDVDALEARDGDDAFGSWHRAHPQIGIATFADVAQASELVINATPGHASVKVLAAIAAHLDGKILIDVANPLDFSQGFPPSLTVANTDSLAEQIQRAVPGARVVKALNTVNASVMVDPAAIGDGHHVLPLCGDDAPAKAEVAELLRTWFGWRDIIDIGELAAARGMEAYLLLWVRLMGALGTPIFNIATVR